MPTEVIETPYTKDIRGFLQPLIKAGIVDSAQSEIPSTTTAFDIAFDFMSHSSRAGAESLPQRLKTEHIPSFLEQTEIQGLSRFQRFYLSWSEPLAKDRFYIYLCNIEHSLNNPAEKKFARATVQDSQKYLRENNITDLAERNKYIDQLIKDYA